MSRFGSLFCFSSRRRHTRWPRDWSSDVCSSDLKILGNTTIGVAGFFRAFQPAGFDLLSWLETATAKFRAFGEGADTNPARSEERRVGKECKCERAERRQRT